MQIKSKIYWYLFPFAVLYWIIIYIRNILFDLNILSSKEYQVPVISVGNITVGGTGKTPFIEYLANLLYKDFSVAVLSRGYKRTSRGFILAGLSSSSKEIGDEPKQIKQKFPDVNVAVDTNRVRGIDKLLNKITGLDVLLLDDAYQHRYVKPGISIVLVDYNHLITKDYILPVGRLREPARETRRANIIIVTKCPKDLKPIERRILQKEINPFPYQNLYFTKITYQIIKPVFNHIEIDSNDLTDKLKNQKPVILIITGIANPRLFKKYARGISSKIKELHFPDHHFFEKSDLDKILEEFRKISNNKIILTTEKDATRFRDINDIPGELKDNMYYVPISIEFLFNQQDEFNKQIFDYVSKNAKYRKMATV